VKEFVLRHRFGLAGGALLVVYYIPYLILNTNSYFHVHDNLDSEIIFNILSAKYFGGTFLANSGRLIC